MNVDALVEMLRNDPAHAEINRSQHFEVMAKETRPEEIHNGRENHSEKVSAAAVVMENSGVFAFPLDYEYDYFDYFDYTLQLPEYSEPAENTFYLAIKRAIDVVVGLIGLLLLSPAMLLVGALIKLFDGGPALYVHTRVGLNGREFRCFKFRTMCIDADDLKEKLKNSSEHSDDRTFKMRNDPRITTIGRWLRRTSIDELPQLLNVLQGSMSLVGPRPPVPGEVEKYTWSDMRRLEVKPGLTCIWQISGRSDLPFPEQIKMDLAYIERRSLLFDFQIMLRTLPAILSCRGAY